MGTDNKIEKPRNKVRQACDNCRKRKLRCTGKEPCSTCEAYSCPCIYSARTANTKRGKVKKNETLEPIPVNNVSVALPASTNPTKLPPMQTSNSTTQFINSGNAMHLPESTLDNQSFLPRESSITAKNTSSSSYDEPSQNTPIIPKYNHETNFIAELPPIVNGDDELYENDENIQIKMNDLQNALNQLRSITLKDNSISTSIDSITKQITNLINEWKPSIDSEKLLRVNERGKKSIETHLMKNKYNDRVCLTRYAICSDSKTGNSKNTQFEPEEPLITDMFGLYSPFQAISFRGIGYICLDYMKRNKTEQIQKTVKETLYLILRYFDMCYIQLAEGKLSIGNPLENYFSRRNIVVTPQSPGPPLVSTPSTGTPGSIALSRQSIISQFIKRFPQNFVFELTGITIDTLLDTVSSDFTMFRLLLQMYDSYKKAFESFMIEMTSTGLRLENKIPTYSPQVIQKLLYFAETEQLLLPLCYQYYRTTQSFYYKTGISIDYLELLITLIDKQLSAYDYYSVTLINDTAVNRALKMGLYRWEYYVGLDEEEADRRRRIWWNLYYYDKKLSLSVGEPSSINDNIISCLLPKAFRDVGFIDSRTFLNNVHRIPVDFRFDNMSITSLAHYGRLGMIQIVSDFQLNVLYNEKYTSIRNSALPPLVKSKLFESLVKEYDLLRCKLQALRNHCSKLFELASSVGSSGATFIDGKPDIEDTASRFSCYFEYHFSVVLSTIDNLEARLSSPPYTEPQFSAVSDIFHEIYYSWNRMNLYLNSFTSVYSFCRIFMYYRCVTVLFLGKCDLLKSMLTKDDIRSIILALHRFRRLWILTLNENYPQVNESPIYREYCKNLSFLCLAGRIVTNKYCNQNLVEIDEIRNWFQEYSPELVDSFDSCMDITSSTYNYLLSPVQKSGFHLQVKKMLESNFLGKTKSKVNDILNKSDNNKNEVNGYSLPVGGHPSVHIPTEVPSIPHVVTMSNGNNIRGGNIPVSSMISQDMQPGIYPTSQQVYPAVKFMKSDTDLVGSRIAPFNDVKQEFGNNPRVGPYGNPIALPDGKIGQQSNPGGLISSISSFNLGTLDEFVNSDMGNLYNILWSDLYPGNDHIS